MRKIDRDRFMCEWGGIILGSFFPPRAISRLIQRIDSVEIFTVVFALYVLIGAICVVTGFMAYKKNVMNKDCREIFMLHFIVGFGVTSLLSFIIPIVLIALGL